MRRFVLSRAGFVLSYLVLVVDGSRRRSWKKDSLTFVRPSVHYQFCDVFFDDHWNSNIFRRRQFASLSPIVKKSQEHQEQPSHCCQRISSMSTAPIIEEMQEAKYREGSKSKNREGSKLSD